MIRIHKSFIKDNPIISVNSRIVGGLKKQFEFGDFFGDLLKGDVGFDGVFKRVGEQKGFVEFFIKIPLLEIEDGKCDMCCNESTSGKKECFTCRGSGVNKYIDWQKAFSISATFTLVLMFLSLIEKEIDCNLKQLMTVSTSTRKGFHGASIDGDVSIDFVCWLRSIGHEYRFQKVIEVMRSVSEQMFGEATCPSDRFNAKTSYLGGFYIVCPGNACEVYSPYVSNLEEGVGLEYTCHNADTPFQQLIFLSALSVLHDMAREAGM